MSKSVWNAVSALALVGLMGAALPAVAQTAAPFPTWSEVKECNYSNSAKQALRTLENVYQNQAPSVADKNLVVSYANTLIACCVADRSSSPKVNAQDSVCLCHSPDQASAVTQGCA